MKELSHRLTLAVLFAFTLCAQIATLPGFAPPKMTAAEQQSARNGLPFQKFSKWLDAFNSGNRDRMARFLADNFPSMEVDSQMNFRERTNGFDLRALERANSTSLTGLVQERDSDQFGRFTIVLEAAEPHYITQLRVIRCKTVPQTRTLGNGVFAEFCRT